MYIYILYIYLNIYGQEGSWYATSPTHAPFSITPKFQLLEVYFLVGDSVEAFCKPSITDPIRKYLFGTQEGKENGRKAAMDAP